MEATSPQIYRLKLGEALLQLVAQKRMAIDPDEMGVRFDQMLRKAKFNSMSVILGGIVGTLGYSRIQLRKNPARSHGARLATVLFGNMFAFLGGSIMLKASMDADLTMNLA